MGAHPEAVSRTSSVLVERTVSSPAQRLLRLISLLQARGHWSGAALSERLGVDRRSIRRDIERGKTVFCQGDYADE